MADPKDENPPEPKPGKKGVKMPVKGGKTVPYEKSDMTPGRDGQTLTR